MIDLFIVNKKYLRWMIFFNDVSDDSMFSGWGWQTQKRLMGLVKILT
jgi:hypothetical protein